MIFLFWNWAIDWKFWKKNHLKKDIDECLINRGGCHSDATCKNTKGSFICTCKTGYSGDGFSCVGLISFWYWKFVLNIIMNRY